MGDYHYFSIVKDGEARRIENPPPKGALSLFSLDLLAQLDPASGIIVDDHGHMVMLGMVFKPVMFHPGADPMAPPKMLVVQRVA